MTEEALRRSSHYRAGEALAAKWVTELGDTEKAREVVSWVAGEAAQRSLHIDRNHWGPQFALLLDVMSEREPHNHGLYVSTVIDTEENYWQGFVDGCSLAVS